MRTLLHTCCAPCLSGARIGFEDEGIPFSTFWYNPNIHPIGEHDRRLTTLIGYRNVDPFELLDPDLTGRVLYSSEIGKHLAGGYISILGTLSVRSRCDICYFIRLVRCAEEAKARGYPSFSTTLLLSKYQKHDRIKAIGEVVSEHTDVEFIYKDLRRYWGRSLDRSREHSLYRQRYCGCELSLSVSGPLIPPRSTHEEPEIGIKPCYQDKTEDSEG